MPKLRAIAATVAAVLFAGGLSVGAALAEDAHTPARSPVDMKAATQKGAHWAPSGVCLLVTGPKR